MSSQRFTKRLQMEYRHLHQSTEDLKQNGIEFFYQEDDIRNIYFVIYGKENTPYYGGFYFFHFYIPDNYPMEPPIVKYHTQGLYMDRCVNRTRYFRFNPNLYTADNDGKVCLSMINTWSGPSWVPTNTIIQVIMAIQALVLHENPLENEPGYEELPDRELYETYNKMVTYMSLDTGMIQMYFRPPFSCFDLREMMRNWICRNKNKIMEYMDTCIGKYGNERMNCQMDVFGMNMNISFDELKEKIQLFLEHEDFRE